MPGVERSFTEPFTIGRGIQARLHVDSGRVSRLHAEVVYEGGGWVLRDTDSTNGTYHEGQRVNEVPLGDETAVRLGREGPFVYLSVEPEPGAWSREPSDRSAPSARSATVARGPLAEDDTQRQADVYRPKDPEEPTAGPTASGAQAEASPVTSPERDGPSSAVSVYGKVVAVVLVLLAVLVLVLVLA